MIKEGGNEAAAGIRRLVRCKTNKGGKNTKGPVRYKSKVARGQNKEKARSPHEGGESGQLPRRTLGDPGRAGVGVDRAAALAAGGEVVPVDRVAGAEYVAGPALGEGALGVALAPAGGGGGGLTLLGRLDGRRRGACALEDGGRVVGERMERDDARLAGEVAPLGGGDFVVVEHVAAV